MTTFKSAPPQSNTRAYKLLLVLRQLGGKAPQSDLFDVCAFAGVTAGHFEREYVSRLLRQNLVRRESDEQLRIEPAGLTAIGCAHEIKLSDHPTMATPRQAPPPRPLSKANMASARPLREGALDYLKIPSLMGDERHEYKPGGGIHGRAAGE